jgi:hypothetical protein
VFHSLPPLSLLPSPPPARSLSLPPQIYRTWRRAGRAPPIPPHSCSLQPTRGIPSCLSHQLEPSAASACRGREGRKEGSHPSIDLSNPIQGEKERFASSFRNSYHCASGRASPRPDPYIPAGFPRRHPPRDLHLTRLPAPWNRHDPRRRRRIPRRGSSIRRRRQPCFTAASSPTPPQLLALCADGRGTGASSPRRGRGDHRWAGSGSHRRKAPNPNPKPQKISAAPSSPSSVSPFRMRYCKLRWIIGSVNLPGR